MSGRCLFIIGFVLLNVFFTTKKNKNIFRTRGSDRDTELRDVEARVDRFKKVLRTLEKKILPTYAMGLSGDANARKTRCQKIHEYNLGITMEELVKELPETCPLRHSLDHCGKLTHFVFGCTRFIHRLSFYFNSESTKSPGRDKGQQ